MATKMETAAIFAYQNLEDMIAHVQLGLLWEKITKGAAQVTVTELVVNLVKQSFNGLH